MLQYTHAQAEHPCFWLEHRHYAHNFNMGVIISFRRECSGHRIHERELGMLLACMPRSMELPKKAGVVWLLNACSGNRMQLEHGQY